MTAHKHYGIPIMYEDIKKRKPKVGAGAVKNKLSKRYHLTSLLFFLGRDNKHPSSIKM
jgi:hypothetical protein